MQETYKHFMITAKEASRITMQKKADFELKEKIRLDNLRIHYRDKICARIETMMDTLNDISTEITVSEDLWDKSFEAFFTELGYKVSRSLGDKDSYIISWANID